MTDRADEKLLSLYVKLYFDEDVSAAVVSNLRSRGFDVTSARGSGLLGEDDDPQLAFAVSQDRALVTHNRHDFERLHGRYLETGQTHRGIIVAKRRSRPEHVAVRLADLLNQVSADEMVNQLWYI